MARRFLLTTATYLAIIRAVWKALDLERPVVVGCSMGGAIVLKLAADYQRELRGIIGLESSAFAPGRYNDYLHHPAIHGGELVASYTYGLCAPKQPRVERARELVVLQSVRSGRLRRRRALLQHRLGRPRGRQAHRHRGVQGVAADRGIRLLVHAGHDARGRQAIPGSRLVIMEGMGHFPMIENYPLFREFLLPELEFIRANGPLADAYIRCPRLLRSPTSNHQQSPLNRLRQ